LDDADKPGVCNRPAFESHFNLIAALIIEYFSRFAAYPNVMLMKNMYKYSPLIAFIYSGIAIFIFMQFFYYEEISALYSFTVPIFIFTPLLLVCIKGASKFGINVSVLLGFILGFAYYGLTNNVNIWPISMAFWLFLGMPAIIGLNMIGILLKKKFMKA
jgi:hypothetical protein